MQRLGCLFLVITAACGTSGPGSGMASLTNTTPPVMSAYSKSFVGADASGTMVMGWTIDFTDSAPNTDCKSDQIKIQASVGIFSSQTPGGSAKHAVLQTGDIVITSMAPPTVSGQFAANMGAKGISNVVGTVSISEFNPDSNGNVTRIKGTINAGGAGMGGGTVTLTGMFDAPTCD